MKTIPITTRVKYAQSGKKPVNQEVTMKADGSGGPVNLEQGGCGCGDSPAKLAPLAAMALGKVAGKLLG